MSDMYKTYLECVRKLQGPQFLPIPKVIHWIKEDLEISTLKILMITTKKQCSKIIEALKMEENKEPGVKNQRRRKIEKNKLRMI